MHFKTSTFLGLICVKKELLKKIHPDLCHIIMKYYVIKMLIIPRKIRCRGLVADKKVYMQFNKSNKIHINNFIPLEIQYIRLGKYYKLKFFLKGSVEKNIISSIQNIEFRALENIRYMKHDVYLKGIVESGLLNVKKNVNQIDNSFNDYLPYCHDWNGHTLIKINKFKTVNRFIHKMIPLKNIKLIIPGVTIKKKCIKIVALLQI